MNISTVTLRVDDLNLAASLYSPDGRAPHPILCICHGLPSGIPNPADDGGYPALANEFCDAGFATLIFNFRGCGASEGNLDILDWNRDLGAAISFLHSLEFADKTRTIVMGFSAGAAVAVCVAASDKRINAVVSAACPARFSFVPTDPQELIRRFRSIGLIRDPGFPDSPDKWADHFRQVSPIDCIGRLHPRPVLILHGDADDLVPVEQAKQLYGAAQEPKELALIPGAGHRLRTSKAAMDRAMTWLLAITTRSRQS